MKSSLPTTLLILLSSRLSLTAPIPSSSHPQDCAYHTCTSSNTHHQPPASSPLPISLTGNPKHGDSSRFNNSPWTPSKDTPPSVALDLDRPLSSEYLQSLSPSEEERQHPFPASSRRPQSQHPVVVPPELEQKITAYLASHPPQTSSSSTRKHRDPKARHHPCHKGTVYLPGNVYITTHHYISRNPDIAVVGVVLVFLALVVMAECSARIVALLGGNRSREDDIPEKGEIYLEDDEVVAVEWRRNGKLLSVQAVRDSLAAIEEEQVIEEKEYS